MLETVGAVRSQLVRYAAPDVLRARIRTAIATTPSEAERGAETAAARQRAPRMSRGWGRAGALAAGLVVAAALGSGATLVVSGRNASSTNVASQVLSSHVRSLMPNHLTDIASSDQHNVKPWFNGRLDYSPNVPRFEEQGFALLGGRLDYIDQRPVAVVVYGRRQHLINVFSWPVPAADEALTMSASNGYNMLHWRHAGIEKWVVSDLNGAELSQFAGLLQRADQPSATVPR